MAFRGKNLLSETRVFTASRGWLKKTLYLWKLLLSNLLGLFLMTFDIKVGSFKWGDYKQIVSEATDFKKFDDVLRMVISGRTKQRQELTDYL
ncbi:MAG: DUF3095 family protein, partial [Dolichospermum sp.]